MTNHAMQPSGVNYQTTKQYHGRIFFQRMCHRGGQVTVTTSTPYKQTLTAACTPMGILGQKTQTATVLDDYYLVVY